jgi:UDP-N-acetylglucosamine diphosphorylase/glucosamine-1-phosphate N-acetyltransferase
MSAIVLFEDYGYVNLLPLAFWRSLFELRIGRRILLDRAAQTLGLPIAGVWTRAWVATVAAQRCCAPANASLGAGTVLVNGRWLADDSTSFPKAPAVGVVDDVVVYVVCDKKLATRLAPNDLLDPARQAAALAGVKRVEAGGRVIHYLWDVVHNLPDVLAEEWNEGHASIDTELDSRVTLQGTENLHIGERCRIHPTAIIDAAVGPVFLSHDVHIGAYSVIEGPIYIGPGSRIYPHAWLHGANAFGPVCKLAGEIDGCLIQGYANKQHEGFLGHSLVGTWVNLGAGSSNSDLKNTYGPVRVPLNGKEVDSGCTFFGAIIGDHAKIGINGTIPTGAVIGFGASAACGRVMPKYIPSFGWVTDDGLVRGDPARLLDVATNVMARRDIDMTDEEIELFLDLGDRVKQFERGHR